MTDKDDLFKGIDEAANNLFDQYVVKNTEAPTPAASPGLDLALDQEPSTDTTPAQTESAPVAESHPEPELKFAAEPEPEPELDFATDPKDDTPTTPQASESISDAPEPVNGDHLFSELEEALLTIDWEINHENITKGRDSLKRLIVSQGWATTSTVGQVTEQMDKVLASMLESPEKSPVSAPSQLKNALQVIRENLDEIDTSNGEVDKLLEAATTNLQSVLSAEITGESLSNQISDDIQTATPIGSVSQPAEEPSFDLGLEMDIETSGGHSSSGEVVPETTINVLKSYATVLKTSIGLVTPMENLFASRPALAKLLSATKQFKTKLIDQEELLGNTFSSDYLSYNGLGTVHDWLESQLDVLKSCIVRIGKLEKLFGKTAGYEKLFTRSKKIRQTLEEQANSIMVAVGGTPTQHQFDLTGEYPAVIQPATAKEPEAPAAAVSAVASPEAMVDKCINLTKSIEFSTADNPPEIGRKIRETLEKLKTALSGSAVHSPGAMAAANAALSIAGHSAKCRWDWLLKTFWGGQLIGIAPEQVVFESKSTFPVSSFKNLTYFSLKKLKSVPWTNLQSKFSGELAELDNATLNDMEIEIANPPATFPGSSKKKVYMVILYSGGIGKIYLIDSPTEAISVAEEALWAPGTSSQSDIAGTLTVYGSTMPIVSVD